MDVILRKWRGSDAEKLAEILINKNIHKYINDLPCPYTIADAKNYIAACLNADKNKFYCFAIEYNGELAGCMSAERGENVKRLSAEVGYYIDECLWGRGVATAAVEKLCAYMFENTDIIRLWATPFEENTPSLRVLEKCGFALEGTLKNAVIKNDKIHDLKLCAKIKNK